MRTKLPNGRAFKCGIHCDDYDQVAENEFIKMCDGPYTTRESIYGAVLTACEKGWTSPIFTEFGIRTIDLENGWPRVIEAEG